MEKTVCTIVPYPTHIRRLAASSLAKPVYRFFLIALLHIPLAYLMRKFSEIATLHAMITLGVGGWFVLQDRNPQRLISVTSYIIGAEVLWRMTNASVFWEFGKYALVFLLILALFKWGLRLKALPLLYFIPLLPSIVLTIGTANIWEAREQISFNLSGPLALTVAALFFSGTRLNREAIQRILLNAVAPIVAIAFLAFYATETASKIIFTTESNFISSGGYGPNQVCAVFGLGALFCWLYILIFQPRGLSLWLMLGLGIGLLTQAIFTFSRGGVFNFTVAALLASFYLVGTEYKRRRLVILSLVVLGVSLYLIIPKLNTFTGGALFQRYLEMNTTGRLEMWQKDLQIWQNNPITGIGPGQAKGFRRLVFGIRVAAHTEYSRMLAEHGIFGLWSLGVLMAMFFSALRQAKTPLAKGITLAFMLWALAEMSHSAMRIASISYLFAVPMARFEDG